MIRRALRWAVAGDRILPPRGRFGFYAGAAVVLAVTYAVSDDEGLQGLVGVVLLLGVLPWLTHRFGRPDPYLAVVQRHNLPAVVLLPSLTIFVVWGGVILFALPDLDLGMWFSFWLVIWPPAELMAYLGRRRLERDGAAAWKPPRPWRDSAVCGAVTAPLIFALVLIDGTSVGESAATGAACGAIVLLLTRGFAWVFVPPGA